MNKWQKWMKETREKLSQISGDDFMTHYFSQNYPVLFSLPDWKAFKWTLDDLKKITGEVQVQVNRNSNANYEIQSPKHRGIMPFNEFIDIMEKGKDNDVYMTAQNLSSNKTVLDILYDDIGPLPSCLLPNVREGFLWIGKNTITPLHHDLTNNLMCQIMGTKLVRLVPPSEFEKLEYNVGVHSHMGWLTNEKVIDKQIKVHDYYLQPSDALFLPVGWWHCVQSFGISITAVYTNFIWYNNYSIGFN